MEVSRAIDLIDDKMCWGRGTFSAHHMPERDEYWQAGEMAIDALKKQEEDRWVSVTERLPKEEDYKPCYGYDDGAVWWLNDIGMMGLGWYYTSTENWAFYNEVTHVEGIVGNVIAWRPLPEPFRKGEE